jgi:hypothetical protein
MALSTGACGAVFADAWALPQRQRTRRDRREFLNGCLEPSHDLLESLAHVRVTINTRT